MDLEFARTTVWRQRADITTHHSAGDSAGNYTGSGVDDFTTDALMKASL